jgi:hypothetical protein
MLRQRFNLLLAISLGCLLILPSVFVGPASADNEKRTDDDTPDELYEGVSGPVFPDEKGQSMMAGGGGGASLKGNKLLGGGGAQAMSGGSGISFPYENFNWSILSWYSTDEGLRIYEASYKGEEIFWEYRVPWVKVGTTFYALNDARLTSGPDLWIYMSGMFLVRAQYYIQQANVDVTVIARFYFNGHMEPWVIVDTNGIAKDIKVGQRFDFDLGDLYDDNQQYYNGANWIAPVTETSILDSTYSEDGSGYQWKVFDTDESGSSYVTDQAALIKPYSQDNSRWYMLAYNGAQFGDPVMYVGTQIINSYQPNFQDPWVGYDAVNWYVSTYSQVYSLYAGPWVHIQV